MRGGSFCHSGQDRPRQPGVLPGVRPPDGHADQPVFPAGQLRACGPRRGRAHPADCAETAGGRRRRRDPGQRPEGGRREAGGRGPEDRPLGLARPAGGRLEKAVAPARRRALSERGVRLRAGRHGAEGNRPVREARPENRLRRLHGRGQDHHRQPDHPVLRCGFRHHHLRRHRRPQNPQGRPAALRRRRPSGHAPVYGHHRRQHPLRQPGGRHGPDCRSRQARQRGFVHPAPSGRLRHRAFGGRGKPEPGAAPAPFHRAGRGLRPAGADSGRGDQLGGYAYRKAD